MQTDEVEMVFLNLRSRLEQGDWFVWRKGNTGIERSGLPRPNFWYVKMATLITWKPNSSNHTFKLIHPYFFLFAGWATNSKTKSNHWYHTPTDAWTMFETTSRWPLKSWLDSTKKYVCIYICVYTYYWHLHGEIQHWMVPFNSHAKKSNGDCRPKYPLHDWNILNKNTYIFIYNIYNIIYSYYYHSYYYMYLQNMSNPSTRTQSPSQRPKNKQTCCPRIMAGKGVSLNHLCSSGTRTWPSWDVPESKSIHMASTQL